MKPKIAEFPIAWEKFQESPRAKGAFLPLGGCRHRLLPRTVLPRSSDVSYEVSLSSSIRSAMRDFLSSTKKMQQRLKAVIPLQGLVSYCRQYRLPSHTARELKSHGHDVVNHDNLSFVHPAWRRDLN